MSLWALWPFSSSFIIAHPAFRGRQHIVKLTTTRSEISSTKCRSNSVVWIFPSSEAISIQVTKLGRDRQLVPTLSSPRVCAYVCLYPYPVNTLTGLTAMREGGALIEGFQTQCTFKYTSLRCGYTYTTGIYIWA